MQNEQAVGQNEQMENQADANVEAGQEVVNKEEATEEKGEEATEVE